MNAKQMLIECVRILRPEDTAMLMKFQTLLYFGIFVHHVHSHRLEKRKKLIQALKSIYLHTNKYSLKEKILKPQGRSHSCEKPNSAILLWKKNPIKLHNL